MQIAHQKVVTIDYTVTDGQGEVIDTSRDGEPLAYIHGVGQLIPGLEQALEGKSVGDSLSTVVTPEQGYGLRDDALEQTVPREQFEAPDQIQVGMQFQAEVEDEQMRVFTVIAVDDEEITLDGNHPLADMTLSFEVQVREVREPTQEELEHGHVHGPGGHHHH